MAARSEGGSCIASRGISWATSRLQNIDITYKNRKNYHAVTQLMRKNLGITQKFSFATRLQRCQFVKSLQLAQTTCAGRFNYSTNFPVTSLPAYDFFNISKRYYGESIDISRSILSLRDGNSALEFFDNLHVCDTANLQRLLRAVVVLPASSNTVDDDSNQSKEASEMQDSAEAAKKPRPVSRSTLFEDPRFLRLLEAISERIASMESRWIAQIGMTLALVRKKLPSLNNLAEKIADVVLTRENALAPRQISMLTFSLSSLGVHNPQLVEFLRLEAVKTLHDFAPQDLHTLLEGMRNWGIYNRELTDLVLEKMTDEIDRFTASDIGFSLRTLSALGLARGFLLRRMASLAFENLQQFNARQIVMIFHSLAKLRFLSHRHCAELLSSLTHSLDILNENYSSQLMMAICLANFTDGDEIIRQLLEKFLPAEVQRLSLVILCNVTYTISYFQLFEYNSLLKAAMTRIIENAHKNGRNLALASEVFASVEIENKTCSFEVPREWKMAIEESVHQEQERSDASRLHNEMAALLTQLQGPYKLNFQKHKAAGPYQVLLLDEETKICFDADNLKRHTNLEMKHRHLSLLGYHPIVVHFWDWRRCRTEDDQIFYLKKLLTAKLRECGRIE